MLTWLIIAIKERGSVVPLPLVRSTKCSLCHGPSRVESVGMKWIRILITQREVTHGELHSMRLPQTGQTFGIVQHMGIHGLSIMIRE